MRTIFLTIFVITIFSNVLLAGVFDNRYPSAKATAMSNATVALNADVWAPYYNPAGLANVHGIQVGSAVQRLFNQPFLQNAFFGAVMPVSSKYGSIALNFEFFGVKYNGSTLSRENTFTISHGFNLVNDIHSSLSFGYNLRYYYWDLGESIENRKLGSAGAFGLDLGLQGTLYHRIYGGIYAYNVNAPTMGKYTKHDLPQRVVVGAGYRPISSVMTSVSLDKTIGFDTQVLGGFEFRPVPWLALRLGAGTRPNRVSAGFGIQFRGFALDYSFQNHPVLPETHKIGLMYIFGKQN
jgi:hypothetical protein